MEVNITFKVNGQKKRKKMNQATRKKVMFSKVKTEQTF